MLAHDSQNNVVFPKKVTMFEDLKLRIKQIKLGDYHSLFLTEDGEVYSAGYGGTLKGGFWRQMFSQGGGALGHFDMRDRFIPQPIEMLMEVNDDIIEIESGSYHAACMT